jgi:hypothetical protein
MINKEHVAPQQPKLKHTLVPLAPMSEVAEIREKNDKTVVLACCTTTCHKLYKTIEPKTYPTATQMPPCTWRSL